MLKTPNFARIIVAAARITESVPDLPDDTLSWLAEGQSALAEHARTLGIETSQHSLLTEVLREQRGRQLDRVGLPRFEELVQTELVSQVADLANLDEMMASLLAAMRDVVEVMTIADLKTTIALGATGSVFAASLGTLAADELEHRGTLH